MRAETANLVPIEIKEELREFLYHEAFLLDNRKYKEWLDLLADDISYYMPLRETVEGVGVENIAQDSSYYEETKNSLTTRVNRLYTKSAWVDNPATRQRHFVSNITIAKGDDEDEYFVRSYFLYKRSRASAVEIEEMFGERHDVIRKIDGAWKITKRVIYPDQAVITTMNMSMFL